MSGRPVAYLQTFRVSADSEYRQCHSPRGETWGLDLLLGVAAGTGQDHGPQIIRASMKLWQRQCSHLGRLLIDPDVRNARSVRAHQKTGFSGVGGSASACAALRILACNL